MPKLSVIMPVYNVAPWLRRATDSVLKQSFTDLELILVDDGSTDGSGALCDEIAAQDARVRVVHQPNQGVGAARNAGIDNARGEWVHFVDSDDLVLQGAYRDLFDELDQEPVDLLRFVCLRTTEAALPPPSANNTWTTAAFAEKTLENGEPAARVTSAELLRLMVQKRVKIAVWRCLVRRALIEKTRFVRGKYGAEELAFWFSVIRENPEFSVRCCRRLAYVYVKRADGLSSTAPQVGALRRLLICEVNMGVFAYYKALGDTGCMAALYRHTLNACLADRCLDERLCMPEPKVQADATPKVLAFLRENRDLLPVTTGGEKQMGRAAARLLLAAPRLYYASHGLQQKVGKLLWPSS